MEGNEEDAVNDTALVGVPNKKKLLQGTGAAVAAIRAEPGLLNDPECLAAILELGQLLQSMMSPGDAEES